MRREMRAVLNPDQQRQFDELNRKHDEERDRHRATTDDLAKFRAAGHPMPWDQALAKDDEKQALRTIFGPGVPAYALIDEQGKLLAVPPELRAPGLDRILEDVNRPPTK